MSDLSFTSKPIPFASKALNETVQLSTSTESGCSHMIYKLYHVLYWKLFANGIDTALKREPVELHVVRIPTMTLRLEQ